MQIKEKDFLKPKPEHGMAKIEVTLEGGMLKVKNMTETPSKELIHRPAYQGDWKLIVAALVGYHV